MPIDYQVISEGRVIIARAGGTVTSREFIEYEVAHAIDERIIPPVSELLIVERNALKLITEDDIQKILKRRTEIQTKPAPHRCGIVVAYDDTHSWDLAKFYEGMINLHFPEIVIVFGDQNIARKWLGIE